MENQRGIYQLTKSVFASFTAPENQGIAGIAGFGGIFCSWHIASIDVNYFLGKYELLFKIVGGFFTIVIAPPLGVFMKDVYEVHIRPRIKFLKK